MKALRLFSLLSVPALLTATALAATPLKNAKQDILVQVKITEETDKRPIYSLDCEWQNMAFTYTVATDASWDPAAHEYDAQTANGSWGKTTAKVKLINHSNCAITADMAVSTDGNTADGVNMTLDKTAKSMATAEGTKVENAPTVDFTVTVSGAPTTQTESSATAVAALTMTITDKV